MLSFCKATADNLPAVKEISKRVIQYNYTRFLGTELVWEFIESGAADKEIETGHEHLTIAYVNDTLIGFYIIKDNCLHLIMVDVPFQHQGYGTVILAKAETELFSYSDKIFLQSFEENIPTNNFYLKNDYRLTDTLFVAEIGKNMSCFIKHPRPKNTQNYIEKI